MSKESQKSRNLNLSNMQRDLAYFTWSYLTRRINEVSNLHDFSVKYHGTFKMQFLAQYVNS